MEKRQRPKIFDPAEKRLKIYDPAEKRRNAEREAAALAFYETLEGAGDFKEYLRRWDAQELTNKQEEEYTLHFMWRFVKRVLDNKTPERRVMLFFAEAFVDVLVGKTWQDSGLSLPWDPVVIPRTRAKMQALRIHFAVRMRMSERPRSKVTAIIREVAADNAVSYETARRAHYHFRRILEKGGKDALANF